MGCNCTKEAVANENNNNNNVKERNDITSKKKKDNVGSEERANNEEPTLRLLSNDPISSDEAEKKVNIERKSSKSVFQRRAMVENNNVGTLQQPKVMRISSVSNGERGAQVMAGWPSWLATVAGEAINGWIPRKADSYEKLEKIGQGTYSSVYKARELETNKIVALKKVRFANMDPESVRFMAREIIILRRLDHPNVMKLEGLITSRVSGSLYLIFEYMEHDLASLASTPGVKFSEAQIKCYTKQLLQGLNHCHSQGILHRDIKGSNLLLDNNNNLKIGDFGLATTFYNKNSQNQPLTSRVVTLWYRPPELLLGSTDYGVTVDLWSTGCVLAELFTGKPILPGRTEVEQLHKIFKLCGSPEEEYWKRSKCSYANIFKPQCFYKRCVAERFKSLIPSSALDLVEVLLAVEPLARGTTAHALQSEFFTTEPCVSDPSSLPKYQPRKETDTKLREEEAKRNKGTSNKQESKAMQASNANDETNVVMSSSRLGPKKELRKHRSFVQRGAVQLSRYSNSVAARDSSHFAIANPRWLEDSVRQNDGDWSNRLLVKPNYSTKAVLGCGEKTERVNYSGPLVSSRGNLDEMLKEHERKIHLAARKAREDMKMNREDKEQTQMFLAAEGR